MAHTTLTHEQSLALLHKLATDDEFRDRFAKHPPSALQGLGVAEAVVAQLSYSCLIPEQLADKATFDRAYTALAMQGADACLPMIVPNVSLSYGTVHRNKQTSAIQDLDVAGLAFA